MTTAAVIAQAHMLLPDLLRATAAEHVLPHFQRLKASDIASKSPGELVTSVDLATEAALTRALRALDASAPCVGEEASAADPELRQALCGPQLCWLIDPLDGTSNFVEGLPHFAIMVAAVEAGTTIASWIYHPLDDRLYTAERGAGAWCDGARLPAQTKAPDWQQQRIGAHVGFLPDVLKDPVASGLEGCAATHVYRSAGHEYPAVATGAKAAMLAYRILPWDHAPGALLVAEAGGSAIRFDGTHYRPDQPGAGIIAGCTPAAALSLRDRLIPEAYRCFLA